MYRRNGTPIGSYRVYVVTTDGTSKVWEVSGYRTWEEAKAGVLVESMSGTFDFEKNIKIIAPGVDLSGCNFHREKLIRSNMAGSNLSRSCLYGVDLSDSFLRDSDLSHVSGMYAKMSANLARCNLFGSDFESADFRKANLMQADLRRASFKKAKFEGSVLDGAIRDPSDPPIPGWVVRGGLLTRA